jgi:hypothetical protein
MRFLSVMLPMAIGRNTWGYVVGIDITVVLSSHQVNSGQATAALLHGVAALMECAAMRVREMGMARHSDP